MPLRHRIGILILFGISSLGVYLGTQYLVLNLLDIKPLVLKLPGEEHIPFLPLLIVLYVVVYAMPAWIILSIQRRRRMVQTIAVFFLALAVHFFFFLFMPVEYILRPELKIGSEILQQAFVFLYRIDGPVNTFPSMHVSFAFISYFVVKRCWPRWAGVFLILAAATSLSTLVVKQHYIADVIGGLVLAMIINRVFIRKRLSDRNRESY